MNRELVDVHGGLRKGRRKQRSNCSKLLDHRKIKRKKKKTSTSASLNIQSLDDHNLSHDKPVCRPRGNS